MTEIMFKKGDRVRLSAAGIAQGLVPNQSSRGRRSVRTADTIGTIVSDRVACVKWDGVQTTSTYHPSFLDTVKGQPYD